MKKKKKEKAKRKLNLGKKGAHMIIFPL